MRYFVWFSYDGTAYHGWQLQPNGNTVQAELQRALSLLLREEITVTGAGRTDTGVHARQMAAHFDTDASFKPEELSKKLNGVLPADISVNRVEQVADDLHARFSAVRRTYHYYIHTRKDPFRRMYSLETHYVLDFPLMNEAAGILMEYDDFGAFCKAGSDVKTTICKVTAAQWHQTAADAWYFEITANRFLRNMVRAVVGTLIEVGESMPALALFLERVEY